MKKLFLHMGFHKTATSSFQETCRKNVDSLAALGFCYPLFSNHSEKEKNIANHSTPIFSAFSEQPETYHMNLRAKIDDIEGLNEHYIRQLEKILSEDKDVILSGEDISRLSANALIKLKNKIEKFDFILMPLAVIRSPYEYHCSEKQQIVKSGEKASLTDYSGQPHRIESVQRALPTTEFIPFKKLCAHKQGPVGGLFEKMGIAPESLNVVSTNEGVSNAHVRAQVLINETNPIFVNGKKNDNWRSICSLGRNSFRSKFLLTEAEMKVIKSKFDKENTFFTEKLGEEFLDETVAFSDDDSIYSELGQYLLNEHALISDPILKSKNAECFRDAAIKLKDVDLKLAVNLMRIAHIARPNGPVIKQKLKEYEEALREQGDKKAPADRKKEESFFKKVWRRLLSTLALKKAK